MGCLLDRVPGCWHFHVYMQVKLKPEWLGWLLSLLNQCLGFFPVDALDLILGKFLVSSEVDSTGLQFPLSECPV